MATMNLRRSNDFTTGIFLQLNLGVALSNGRTFQQNVRVEKMSGETENLDSSIQIVGDMAHIDVIRSKTSQSLDLRVSATTSLLDAEKLIHSLALELLLS